jgi:hypothetical protein
MRNSVRNPSENITAFLWCTVTLLSLSWYPLTAFYLPTTIHYTTPLWFSYATLFVAVVTGLATAKLLVLEFEKKTLFIVFVASALFGSLIPFPYNIPALFLVAATSLRSLALLLKTKRSTEMISATSTSLFVCGLVLGLQAAVLPFFVLFASRFHRIDWLAPLLSTLFQMLGSSASQAHGDLFVQYADRVYSLIPSWEALGLYPALNILMGGFLFFSLMSMPRRSYVFLLLTLAIYMVMRYIGLVYALLELEKASVFWRVDVMTISILPLILFLSVLFKFPSREQVIQFHFLNRASVKPSLTFSVLLVVLCLSATGFFGFVDPGERKQGRILIDEKHSNWEWTTEEFNTTWYGERSTYNYYSLAQFLKYYYHVDQKAEDITDALLAEYDILFIKTPTEPFSETEIVAIKRFVERGGGLLLIGDHTNVFGITTNLNPLASQFGAAFRYDGQYDVSGELSVYRRPVVLPHPVVQQMPAFMFATGCMLDAPLLAENAIIGYGIKSVYLDYSRPNFFPKDARNTETMEFGLFVQAAGIPFGKGRVFLFTDSTVWSNFYMFIPGKPELLLGIMEWLNRKNTFLVNAKPFFLLLTLISFAAVLFTARRLKKGEIVFVSLLVGLSFTPLTIFALEQLNKEAYPAPQPHTRYLEVNFEAEHSDFELPVLHTTQRTEKSYHTFYVWLQRLGYVPRLAPSFQEALKGDVVVILNPTQAFRPEELHAANEFLKRGGKLLLLDDPARSGHAMANQFLAGVGSELTMHNHPPTPISIRKKPDDTTRIATYAAGEVRGGTALLVARGRRPEPGESFYPVADGHDHRHDEHGHQHFYPGDLRRATPQGGLPPVDFVPRGSISSLQPPIDTLADRPIMAVEAIGEGRLVAAATSFLFTDREMGFTSTRPNDKQRRIYELEYWIFEEVLGLRK